MRPHAKGLKSGQAVHSGTKKFVRRMPRPPPNRRRRPRQTRSLLLAFPPSLFSQIDPAQCLLVFLYLSARDVCLAAPVSRSWRRFCVDERLWKHLKQLAAPHVSLPVHDGIPGPIVLRQAFWSGTGVSAEANAENQEENKLDVNPDLLDAGVQLEAGLGSSVSNSSSNPNSGGLSTTDFVTSDRGSSGSDHAGGPAGLERSVVSASYRTLVKLTLLQRQIKEQAKEIQALIHRAKAHPPPKAGKKPSSNKKRKKKKHKKKTAQLSPPQKPNYPPTITTTTSSTSSPPSFSSSHSSSQPSMALPAAVALSSSASPSSAAAAHAAAAASSSSSVKNSPTLSFATCLPLCLDTVPALVVAIVGDAKSGVSSLEKVVSSASSFGSCLSSCYACSGSAAVASTVLDVEGLASGDLGLVLMFDLTQPGSLARVVPVMSQLIQDDRYRGMAKVLLGNKADLAKARAISFERARQVAHTLQMPYVEASCRTGHGICLALDLIAHQQLMLRQEPASPHKQARVARFGLPSSSLNGHVADREGPGCRTCHASSSSSTSTPRSVASPVSSSAMLPTSGSAIVSKKASPTGPLSSTNDDNDPSLPPTSAPKKPAFIASKANVVHNQPSPSPFSNEGLVARAGSGSEADSDSDTDPMGREEKDAVGRERGEREEEPTGKHGGLRGEREEKAPPILQTGNSLFAKAIQNKAGPLSKNAAMEEEMSLADDDHTATEISDGPAVRRSSKWSGKYYHHKEKDHHHHHHHNHHHKSEHPPRTRSGDAGLSDRPDREWKERGDRPALGKDRGDRPATGVGAGAGGHKKAGLETQEREKALPKKKRAENHGAGSGAGNVAHGGGKSERARKR